ncbi:MAG: PqqD family protein [Parasporobacterium sp.]|nr:PqqD family protein [Parasporobacterium sp.]
MIIKPDYILSQVMDYYFIMGAGKDACVPTQILSLNETGAFLWNILKKGAEPEELTARLIEEYEVDEITAKKDVESFLSCLLEKGLVEK